MLNKIQITGKLIILLLLTSLIPLVIAGLVISNISGSAISAQVFNQLDSLRAVKKSQIENYFQQINDQIITYSNDLMVIDAMHDFTAGFESLPDEVQFDPTQLNRFRSRLVSYYESGFQQEFVKKNESNINVNSLPPNNASGVLVQHQYIERNSNPIGSKHLLDNSGSQTSYDKFHERYHPIMRDYLEKFGYYDIFLIDIKTGSIVYSVFKEIDFGTSLNDGAYRDSNLARVFREAAKSSDRNSIHLLDFEPYVPSYNAAASFIASPIFDEKNNKIGVIAFQMPVDRINAVMQQHEGMGETGETYLVGTDMLMRSQSRLEEKNTILAKKIDTQAVRDLFKGESGSEIISDYRGVSVLSSFSPTDINGLDWGIVAEIDESEALAAVSKLKMSTLIFVLITAVLTIVFAWFIANRVSRPLKQAVKVADGIAEGKLSYPIHVDSKDEIGQLMEALKSMQSKLSDMVTEIRTGANNVSTSSSEISRGNTDLSQRTEEQASSLEETASSIEELTGSVNQNADNARQANQLASSARNQAGEGGKVVSSAITAMEEINTSSQKIADIIGVIDDIAFQTNLLALNAAVEAARAGEQGRGFAVVASEVRNLAQRSAEAAKEIKNLINDSVGKVTEGSRLVNESGETLDEIVLSVKKVSDIVAEIAASSNEQASGIEQVNKAVAQMDQMTQQNAALVEEAAAASESMDEQAKELSSLMDFFELDNVAHDVVKHEASSDTKAERRGENRPWDTANKTRQPEKRPETAAPAPAPLAKAASGSDSEWEEF